MKKNSIFILVLLSFICMSCKQASFDQMPAPHGYGTVIIGIAGNGVSRAVGENGLPVIKDSKMTIKVTKDDGVLIKEKDFSESETKSLSLTLSVGEKIIVKVIVENASARWSGSAEHTVEEGTNNISVKLKKSAAVLNNLLFGTDKLHGQDVHVGGHHAPYTLTLKIGSKEITKTNILRHSFCRDNKGRTYLSYNIGNQWNIERYTSEGDKEDKNFDGFLGASPLILASDHATGKVYIAAEISSGSSGNMKLYRINEAGGPPIELTGASLGNLTGYAVYNNVLIASGHGMGGPELKMYRINGDQLSEITLSAQPNLREDTKIAFGASAGWGHGTINDLYMTKDTLYLLFSAFHNHSSNSYSLGGIVKYSYSVNGTTASISTPVRIGIADGHTSDGNSIYSTEESNFYGPVKVVGFDEENLYIADDGVTFKYQKGKPRITANKNRIATLNKGTNTLTFNDAPSGITWLGEDPVWTGVSTKTIVWKKSSTGHGFDYYQLDSYNTAPATGNSIAASASHNNYFIDVFCFDEAGNIYIVGYSSGNFSIHRFELKDDGSYDSSATVSNTLPDQPLAIAVDISGAVKDSAAQPVNALYCSYDDSDKSYIKRLTWKRNAIFSAHTVQEAAGFAGSGTFGGHQDVGNNKTRFTALAADKNGFYVGETFKNTTTKKYTINVKKYAHTAVNYNAAESTIEVVPETTYNSYSPGADICSPSEKINALSIQDGVLYGVTAKEFRNDNNPAGEPQKASTSGKLWKIGKTDSAFTSDTLKCLHSSEPNHLPGSDNERKEGGKFAPCRFIAVMPKKLVIASDGFYGYVESPTSRKADQYNFIWTFELKADGSIGDPNSTDKGTDVSFSKSLDNDSYFAWE